MTEGPREVKLVKMDQETIIFERALAERARAQELWVREINRPSFLQVFLFGCAIAGLAYCILQLALLSLQ